MPQAGSNARRLLTTIVALAVVAIGAWTLAGHFTGRSSPATATIAIGGSALPDEHLAAKERTAVASKQASFKRFAGVAPLPPPGLPLGQIYDGLKRRADMGDAEAATRLFHEVHRCLEVRRTRRLLAEISPADATSGNANDREIGFVRAGQAVQFKRVREIGRAHV